MKPFEKLLFGGVLGCFLVSPVFNGCRPCFSQQSVKNIAEGHLSSDFLRDDETARRIASGKLLNYDIKAAMPKAPKLYAPDGPLRVDTFAFKFINGLKQLGYIFRNDPGNASRPLFLAGYYNFLNDYKLPKTDIITKGALFQLDQQLARQEEVDKENCAELNEMVDFEAIDYRDESPDFANFPPSRHYYSRRYNFLASLPEDLRSYSAPDITAIRISNSANSFFAPINVKPPSVQGQLLTLISDCEGVGQMAYIWALFIVSAVEDSGVSGHRLGRDGLRDFYAISWGKDDHKGSDGFATSRAKNNPKDDFASTFAMYVTEGRIFRLLIQKDADLEKKYYWMRDNVFEGIEYDTGSPVYIPPPPGVSRVSSYSEAYSYSIRNPRYRCEFIYPGDTVAKEAAVLPAQAKPGKTVNKIPVLHLEVSSGALKN